MSEHSLSRRALRALQLVSAVGMVCLTLFLIGLCTNTIVLPFVNLSGAVTSVSENVEPTLDKPSELPATPALSFLEMLNHFSAPTGEGAHRSGEVYDEHETIVLSSLPTELFPAAAKVGDRVALVARQGFLVRTNPDGSRTLFDGDGTLIFESMPAGFDFTGHWDKEERAVFVSGEGFVVYNRQSGVFEPTDYVGELSAITGVDLPVYYDRPDSRIALSYKNGKYGYYYTDTGKPNYQYTHSGQSYQFRDGYGALGTDGGVIIVDPTASRAFFTWGTFVQPTREGRELLGYYRFEYGLMRTSLKTEDGARDFVLTHANQPFYLPQDFRLVSYSDGVFLLEKDGRYGYLDYTGRWITPPELVYAEPFCEGLAVVTRADGKMGVISRTGTFVIPCEFDLITGSSGGLLTLYSSGRWVVVEKVRVS